MISKVKRSFLILCLFLFFQNCSSNNEHLQELFIHDKELLNEFVNAAYQDQSLHSGYSRFVRFENLSERTKERIEKLALRDVRYVVMEPLDCPTGTKYTLEIIYDGNWHLEYSPCGFNNFVPQGHNEEGFIETWGMDDHWILWVNNDYIG